MSKIGKIEETLKEWKDKLSECTDDESQEGMYIQGWIDCLEMVLRNIKQPSNTQMHMDAFECKNCGFNDGVLELQCPMCNDTVKRQ